MTFILILGVIFAGWCAICFAGGVLKIVMEVVSFLAKFAMGLFVMMIIFQILPIKFPSPWITFLVYIIGASLLFYLLISLAKSFRLVGYSINFLIDSLVVLLAASLLKDRISISFVAHLITLFLFPRLMWLSDRLCTTREYSHSIRSFWSNTITDYYTVSDFDWWDGTGDCRKMLPLQIVLSCIFYLLGNITILDMHTIQSDWLLVLYLILVTAANLLFDLFVFSRLDEEVC